MTYVFYSLLENPIQWKCHCNPLKNATYHIPVETRIQFKVKENSLIGEIKLMWWTTYLQTATLTHTLSHTKVLMTPQYLLSLYQRFANFRTSKPSKKFLRNLKIFFFDLVVVVVSTNLSKQLNTFCHVYHPPHDFHLCCINN